MLCALLNNCPSNQKKKRGDLKPDGHFRSINWRSNKINYALAHITLKWSQLSETTKFGVF